MGEWLHRFWLRAAYRCSPSGIPYHSSILRIKLFVLIRYAFLLRAYTACASLRNLVENVRRVRGTLPRKRSTIPFLDFSDLSLAAWCFCRYSDPRVLCNFTCAKPRAALTYGQIQIDICAEREEGKSVVTLSTARICMMYEDREPLSFESTFRLLFAVYA